MFKMFSALSLAVTLAAGVVLVGCSKAPAPADESAPPAGDAAVQEASPSDLPEGFAELSDADRAAALAQKVCPVSDQALGSMGTPIKVTVKGRDVFLCCAGCKNQLLEDPDTFLAKLDAN